MPNVAPDGPLGTEQKGLLSPLADPLGQVVKYATKPVGRLTGAIGEPTGDAALRLQNTMANEVKYSNENKKESEMAGGKPIGGQTQTAENPLGLNK